MGTGSARAAPRRDPGSRRGIRSVLVLERNPNARRVQRGPSAVERAAAAAVPGNPLGVLLPRPLASARAVGCLAIVVVPPARRDDAVRPGFQDVVPPARAPLQRVLYRAGRSSWGVSTSAPTLESGRGSSRAPRRGPSSRRVAPARDAERCPGNRRACGAGDRRGPVWSGDSRGPAGGRPSAAACESFKASARRRIGGVLLLRPGSSLRRVESSVRARGRCAEGGAAEEILGVGHELPVSWI